MNTHPAPGASASAGRHRWRYAAVALAAALGAEAVVALHPHFEVEAVFGFHAWFAFGACAALIVVARAVSRLLGRRDGFYRPHDG